MSGGWFDYRDSMLYELADRERDIEIADLLKDLANLLHAEDYYISGDTCEETYNEELNKFRKKWFKGSRITRLRGYVDQKMNDTKKDLYSMIGVDDD